MAIWSVISFRQEHCTRKIVYRDKLYSISYCFEFLVLALIVIADVHGHGELKIELSCISVTCRDIELFLWVPSVLTVLKKSRNNDWCFIIDIILKNIGNNTEYCFDSNGNAEFKCECNEGFDGKRCEEGCSLDCGINGICTTEIDEFGIKKSKCLCDENPCQNGGACTSIINADIQAYVITNADIFRIY